MYIYTYFEKYFGLQAKLQSCSVQFCIKVHSLVNTALALAMRALFIEIQRYNTMIVFNTTHHLLHNARHYERC